MFLPTECAFKYSLVVTMSWFIEMHKLLCEKWMLQGFLVNFPSVHKNSMNSLFGKYWQLS